MYPVIRLVVVLLGAASVPVLAQGPLTLADAEALALAQAPSLLRARANVDATAARAISAGRLPDPQLSFGAINVPTDSYRLNQDDMTMTMVGIRQVFPPWGGLDSRAQRAAGEQAQEQARLEIERRSLLRDVRHTWLELYYAQGAQRLLETERELARRDLVAAEGRRRAARDTLRAVYQARQQLARFDERLPMLRAQSEQTRAKLSRWIGAAARDPLPDTLPELPVPPAFNPELNPEWRAAQAGLDTARAEVDMARAEYRPGVMFDLQYGFRQPMPDGATRPNMITAMVTLDLPIFRAKRQDPRLAASESLESAARFMSEDKQRELQAMDQSLRAERSALVERLRIYEQELLPSLRHEEQDAGAGFVRELSERLMVRMKSVDAELELLRLRIDLAKNQTELLYLNGEEPHS